MAGYLGKVGQRDFTVAILARATVSAGVIDIAVNPALAITIELCPTHPLAVDVIHQQCCRLPVACIIGESVEKMAAFVINEQQMHARAVGNGMCSGLV